MRVRYGDLSCFSTRTCRGTARGFTAPAAKCSSSSTRWHPGSNPVFRRTHVELSPTMQGRMTCNADGNEILFRVVAGVAAKLFVMDFQVRHRTARLTTPAIATQDLPSQVLVGWRIEPQGCRFWTSGAHDTFSLSPPRNACRCSTGRNLKNLIIENSSVSGSPLSRFAPARKSAQIISRQ
jgi:hypothetical protein